VDITTLGIGIDTRQVNTAKDTMDAFARSAEKAEQAAAGVGEGSKKGAKGVKDLEDSMASASMKGVLGANAIEKSIEIAIDAVKQLYALMKEAGDYADLADMTGASAENIAKLRTAADVAGVSMQSMAGYMNQMTRVLKSTDEDGDKAAKALQRIGINFKDFDSMDPAERIAAVGQAMGKYADGAEKTEIAQALFGRGAGNVLKVLKELSDATAFSTRLTNESIAAVDGLNDAQARFTSQSQQYIQSVLVGTVPATEAFKLVIKETTASMFGMGDAATSLSANTGMSEFTTQSGHFLAGMLTAFQVLYRAIETVINALGTVLKLAGNLLTLDFKGVITSIEDLGAKAKAIWSEQFAMSSYADKIKAIGKAARDASAAAAGGENASGVQPKIETGPTDKQIKDAREFDKLIAATAAKASGYNANFIEQMNLINAQAKERNYTEEQYRQAVDALIAQQPFFTEGVRKGTKAVEDAKKKTEEFYKLVTGGDLKLAGYNENFIEQMKLINAESLKQGFSEKQRQAAINNLIQQQPFYTQGIKDQAAAAKAYQDAEAKAFEAAEKGDAAAVKAAEDAATKAEEELANFGKLKSAIAETTLLRLQDKLAAVGGKDDVLEAQIAAQKRLIEALKGIEVKEAAKKGAEEAAKEFEKAWDQIGQSLTDQLMKGSLKAADLIKNLFKTMILQPTIMGAARGFGASFMGGAAGGAGAGGGGMGGIGGMAGSYAGTALFGGVGAAASGAYTAAAAGGAGTIGSMGAGAMAGLGAIPVAGWVVLAAVAAYALYKKFGKGGGPKVEGSAGYGAGDLVGKYGNEMDSNALSAVKDLNANYRRMTQALGSTAANAQFGVGYSMDPRGDAPSMVQVRSQYGEVLNRDAGRTAEDLAKALAEAQATVMVEALRNSGLDAQMLAYFDKITEGMTDEAKLAAFEQVAAVGQYWKQLQMFGGVLKGLGSISLEAAVSLGELSGGVEVLMSNLATYQEHFLSPAEQASAKYQQIAATLNEAGSGWYGFSEQLLRTYDKDFFRKVIEGLNLEDEGDRMRYASMMKVAGAFAQLKEAEEAAASSTEDLAKRYQEASDRYNDALDTLRDAYDRQKDVLTTTRDAMRDATQSFLDFNDSLRVDQTLSNLNPQERMAELQRQYGVAQDKAVTGGYQAEDVQRMQDAARALLQGGREFYGSGAGYDDLFKKITQEMELAAGSTKYAQDIAQSQLNALERQVGYLVNIDNTLLTVQQALIEFLGARQDLYMLGYPHAEGLSRVPYDNYPALLHKDETVLPQNESAFIRGLPDFSGELRALRQEVAALRKENRQDAGNTIGATYTAAQQSAQVQSEAVIRAARQRLYQSRSRPVLA